MVAQRQFSLQRSAPAANRCDAVLSEVANASRGRTGLPNLGNTCFVNAVVQCLRALPGFVARLDDALAPLAQRRVTGRAERQLIRAETLQDLLTGLAPDHRETQRNGFHGTRIKRQRSMWVDSGDDGKVATMVRLKRFLSAVSKCCDLVAPEGAQQDPQDAEELLQFLLDTLQEVLQPSSPSHSALESQNDRETELECLRSLKECDVASPNSYKNAVEVLGDVRWRRYQTANASLIAEMFTGQTVRGSQCHSCSNMTCLHQEFRVLSLEPGSVRSLHTLEQCLETHRRREKLIADNQVFCGGRCQAKTDQTTQVLLQRVPDTLVIQLPRFKQTDWQTLIEKVDYSIEFPIDESLDVTANMFLGDSTRPVHYHLQAVCALFGSSLEDRHYVAYVRDTTQQIEALLSETRPRDTDRWIKFDDTFVTNVDAATVRRETQSTAYMLFYTLVETPSSEARQAESHDSTRPVRGGLPNVGNTCFVNAILQCLRTIPGFVDQLEYALLPLVQRQPQPTDRSETKLALAQTMSDLLTGLTSSVLRNSSQTKRKRPTQTNITDDSTTATMTRLLCFLLAASEVASESDSSSGLVSSEIGHQSQQDAQELLLFLLESVHELLLPPSQGQNNSIESGLEDPTEKECLRVLRKCNIDQPNTYNTAVECLGDVRWRRYATGNASFIAEMFTGQSVRGSICRRCMQLTCVHEVFRTITLDLASSRASQSLEQCLESQRLLEDLVADNRVFCGHCREKTNHRTQMLLQRVPRTLVIHLKRFKQVDWQTRVEKVNERVDFPIDQPLDLTANMFLRDPKRPHLYQLQAVCAHLGNSLDAGHYVAYARDSTQRNGAGGHTTQPRDIDRWIKFDDNVVTTMDPATVRRETQHTAYLLVYTHVDPKRSEASQATSRTSSSSAPSGSSNAFDCLELHGFSGPFWAL